LLSLNERTVKKIRLNKKVENLDIFYSSVKKPSVLGKKCGTQDQLLDTEFKKTTNELLPTPYFLNPENRTYRLSPKFGKKLPLLAE